MKLTIDYNLLWLIFFSTKVAVVSFTPAVTAGLNVTLNEYYGKKYGYRLWYVSWIPFYRGKWQKSVIPLYGCQRHRRCVKQLKSSPVFSSSYAFSPSTPVISFAIFSLFSSILVIWPSSICTMRPAYIATSGVSKKTRIKRARDILLKLGLGKRLHNKPSQMSGGQQQRVSIAPIDKLMPFNAVIISEPTLYFFTTSFASISAKKFPPLFLLTSYMRLFSHCPPPVDIQNSWVLNT